LQSKFGLNELLGRCSGGKRQPKSASALGECKAGEDAKSNAGRNANGDIAIDNAQGAAYASTDGEANTCCLVA